MEILKKQFVSQSKGLERVKVDVTEWGEPDETGKKKETFVFVRELTAREKDQYENSMVFIKKGRQQFNLLDLRARLAVLVCCDEDWNPVFGQEDVEWLSQKGCRPLTRIFNAAQKLNSITDEDEEELLKN